MDDLQRVGAHRAPKKRGGGWIGFGWAVLATGVLVGDPPCPHIDHFQRFITEKYGIPVVLGTHPIPQKYHGPHCALGSWTDPAWKDLLAPSLADEATRTAYN